MNNQKETKSSFNVSTVRGSVLCSFVPYCCSWGSNTPGGMRVARVALAPRSPRSSPRVSSRNWRRRMNRSLSAHPSQAPRFAKDSVARVELLWCFSLLPDGEGKRFHLTRGRFLANQQGARSVSEFLELTLKREIGICLWLFYASVIL